VKPGPHYDAHIKQALRGVLGAVLLGYAVLCITALVAFML
jgi:hypothetical protein